MDYALWPKDANMWTDEGRMAPQRQGGGGYEQAPFYQQTEATRLAVNAAQDNLKQKYSGLGNFEIDMLPPEGLNHTQDMMNSYDNNYQLQNYSQHARQMPIMEGYAPTETEVPAKRKDYLPKREELLQPRRDEHHQAGEHVRYDRSFPGANVLEGNNPYAKGKNDKSNEGGKGTFNQSVVKPMCFDQPQFEGGYESYKNVYREQPTYQENYNVGYESSHRHRDGRSRSEEPKTNRYQVQEVPKPSYDPMERFYQEQIAKQAAAAKPIEQPNYDKATESPQYAKAMEAFDEMFQKKFSMENNEYGKSSRQPSPHRHKQGRHHDHYQSDDYDIRHPRRVRSKSVPSMAQEFDEAMSDIGFYSTDRKHRSLESQLPGMLDGQDADPVIELRRMMDQGIRAVLERGLPTEKTNKKSRPRSGNRSPEARSRRHYDDDELPHRYKKPQVQTVTILTDPFPNQRKRQRSMKLDAPRLTFEGKDMEPVDPRKIELPPEKPKKMENKKRYSQKLSPLINNMPILPSLPAPVQTPAQPKNQHLDKPWLDVGASGESSNVSAEESDVDDRRRMNNPSDYRDFFSRDNSTMDMKNFQQALRKSDFADIAMLERQIKDVDKQLLKWEHGLSEDKEALDDKYVNKRAKAPWDESDMRAAFERSWKDELAKMTSSHDKPNKGGKDKPTEFRQVGHRKPTPRDSLEMAKSEYSKRLSQGQQSLKPGKNSPRRHTWDQGCAEKSRHGRETWDAPAEVDMPAVPKTGWQIDEQSDDTWRSSPYIPSSNDEVETPPMRRRPGPRGTKSEAVRGRKAYIAESDASAYEDM